MKYIVTTQTKYFHISDIFWMDELRKNDIDIDRYIKECNHKVTIIKWRENINRISLVECPTFDIQHEPPLGKITTIDYKNNILKERVFNNHIYHHRHMFVPDHYDGFDIKASKERSRIINELKPIKNKIGTIKNWTKFCEKNGINM